MDNRYDDLIDNENFYKIINPYIESGILTEIYASNYISVFNVANKIYVTCLHMVSNGIIPGHLTGKEEIIDEINDNSFAFKMQVNFTKFLIQACFNFGADRFNYWKNWSKNPKIKSDTDPKFDEKIMKKYPKKSK